MEFEFVAQVERHFSFTTTKIQLHSAKNIFFCVRRPATPIAQYLCSEQILFPMKKTYTISSATWNSSVYILIFNQMISFTTNRKSLIFIQPENFLYWNRLSLQHNGIVCARVWQLMSQVYAIYRSLILDALIDNTKLCVIRSLNENFRLVSRVFMMRSMTAAAE